MDVNNGGLTNTGLLAASNGGRLLVMDSLVNQGFVEAAAASLVHFAASGVQNGIGGTLRGSGEIEFTNLFINEGVIAPGASIGTLTIDPTGTSGAAIQFGNNSVVEIELLNSAAFDVLNITGDVSLGGTLEISLLSGFVPIAADTFNILNFENASFATVGEFVNVTDGGTLMTAGGEGTFTVHYVSNNPSFGGYVRLSNFTLSAVPEPTAAGLFALTGLAVLAGRRNLSRRD